MIKVTNIKCFDGSVHPDTNTAKKHLNKLYADLLLKTTSEIVDLSLTKHRHTLVAEYLDRTLHVFEKLRAIQNDLILTNEEEEQY